MKDQVYLLGPKLLIPEDLPWSWSEIWLQLLIHHSLNCILLRDHLRVGSIFFELSNGDSDERFEEFRSTQIKCSLVVEFGLIDAF